MINAKYQFLKLVVLSAFSLFLLAPSSSYSEDTPIRIGALLPMTGDVAFWGQSMREAIDFAFSSMKPDIKKNISITFDDDQFQPAKATSAFQSLLSTKKINVVLVAGSGIGNTIAPIAEKNKVVMFAIGASDINVVKGRKFAFTHWVNPDMEGKIMAEQIAKRGYKNIAILEQEHDGLKALSNGLRANLLKFAPNTQIIYQNSFIPGSNDFRDTFPILKGKQVDAIATLFFPAAIGSFAQQAKQAGMSQTLFGAETFEDNDMLKSFRPYLIDDWYATGASPTQEYSKRFAESFKKEPGFANPNSYDSVMLIASALEARGNSAINTEEIATYLHNVKNFSGALGTYSATGDNRFEVAGVAKKITQEGNEPLDLK